MAADRASGPSDLERPPARRVSRPLLVSIGGLVVVALVIAAVVQRRRIDDFERTLARVQVDAQLIGENDLDRFRPPTAETAPPIAGAHVVSVTAGAEPSSYVVDYEISMSGEVACVRVAMTSSGAEVTEAEVSCADFTFAPTL